MQKISPLIVCQICTNIFTDPVILCSNQHTFDKVCAVQRLINNPSCPTCHEAIDPKRPLVSNRTVIQLLKKNSPSIECTICSDIFTDPVMLCSNHHTFDRVCALQWIEHKPNCPTCREAINPNLPLVSNRTVIELIGEYNSSVDPEQRVPLPQFESVLPHIVKVKGKQLKGPPSDPPVLPNGAQLVVPPPWAIGPIAPPAAPLWHWAIEGYDDTITQLLDAYTLTFGYIIGMGVLGFPMLVGYSLYFLQNRNFSFTPVEKKNTKILLTAFTFFASTGSLAKICSVALKNLNKKSGRRQYG
ncbi:MAG: U-box domain-containing protein [Rhabdochlamydiaceae bacterium]